jgi:hypothetical protein
METTPTQHRLHHTCERQLNTAHRVVRTVGIGPRTTASGRLMDGDQGATPTGTPSRHVAS